MGPKSRCNRSSNISNSLLKKSENLSQLSKEISVQRDLGALRTALMNIICNKSREIHLFSFYKYIVFPPAMFKNIKRLFFHLCSALQQSRVAAWVVTLSQSSDLCSECIILAGATVRGTCWHRDLYYDMRDLK